MKCEKDFSLRMKVLYLSKSQLKEHLNNCAVCRDSLDRAYKLYSQEKEDPHLKSFPLFGAAKDKEEFLNFWKMSLSSKKERFDYYKVQLKEKMDKTSMKSLILELVTELIKSLIAEERKDKLNRRMSLREIIEIMDRELLDQEFEMFFGFSKEDLIKIINQRLSTEEDIKALPGK